MDNQMSMKILVLLSVVYGATIAVLAVADVGDNVMKMFTIIGAIVLGVLWVARALFSKK